MKANIIVWSEIGHTPATRRIGSYCDELARIDIEVDGIADAREAAVSLVKKTPHAVRGYFNVPEHPNQNLRSGWV